MGAHIIAEFRFELGKVDHQHIRENAVAQINHIDHELAVAVAEGIGGAAGRGSDAQPRAEFPSALSQANSVTGTITTRKVAVLVAGGGESTGTPSSDGYTAHSSTEAYKHAKPVAASDERGALLQRAGVNEVRQADDTNGLVPEWAWRQRRRAVVRRRRTSSRSSPRH